MTKKRKKREANKKEMKWEKREYTRGNREREMKGNDPEN